MITSQCQATKSASVEMLMGLLRQRKTRRFGSGMELPGGPLRYRSRLPPIPLSHEEMHYLLFAGVGKTGPHLADMQYASRPGHEDGQGMAIMNFHGRTAPSACAANATNLFITNDDGVYFVSSVSDPDSGTSPELLTLQSERLRIPREMPYMLSFNQWYANRPGSLYVIPVTDVASVYFNLLLVLLSKEYGYFIVDSDNGHRSCGLDDFRRSRGGHLYDDPGKRRTMTLRELDAAIADTAIQEQGVIAQNMFLMLQALGLGGGIQSVGSGRHLLGWEPQIFPGLGFQFLKSPIEGVRSNPVGVPNVWEGLCPPFVPTMEGAVRTLVASKFGPNGIYAEQGRPWSRSETGQSIVPHDEQAIEATIRFCEYVYQTYGRFPAHADAFKTVVAFQAHHIDLDFYDKFYPESSVPSTHREHFATWHDEHEWKCWSQTNLEEGMR